MKSELLNLFYKMITELSNCLTEWYLLNLFYMLPELLNLSYRMIPELMYISVSTVYTPVLEGSLSPQLQCIR